MLRFLFLVAVCTSLVHSAAQAGTPRIRLSWDRCDPLVTSKGCKDGAPYRLIVSGIGWSEPIRGTGSRIRVAPLDGGTLADAWRFDAAGCMNSEWSLAIRLRRHHAPFS